MCKILAFTNTTKLKHSAVNEIGNLLLALEKDGFGYSILGEKGQYGEKCIADSFRSRIGRANVIDLPIVTKRYNHFGMASANTGPGIFHGRTSTNVLGLANCHPMQREGWSLIHNGVVSDHGNFYAKLTSNDSEHVLYRLIEGINSIEQHLSGYYAFAAIAPNGALHIARDGYATLFIAWSKTLESYVIATTESLLEEAAELCKFKIGPIEAIIDDTYMIWKDNELLTSQAIKPRGWTSYEASFSEASLGYKVTEHGYETYNSHTGRYTYAATSPHGDTTSQVEDLSGLSWEEYCQRRDAIESKRNNSLGVALVKAVEAQQSRGGGGEVQITNEGLTTEALLNQDPEREEQYYQYRQELENMDAGYNIYDVDGRPINLMDFYKMDFIAQENCTVTRPDGTVLEPFEGEGWAPRLRNG